MYDAAGDEAFPHCEDLRCSPSDHVFARAAATRDPWTRGGSSGVRGALEIWNAKIFAPESSLSLGPDAAPVHEVAFNHNGKMLATAGADGAVRLFDLNAGKQIMSWTAHPRGEAATSLAFCADQNAVFSAGTDGVVTEWSLHRLRSVIHSVDVERERSTRGGIAETPNREAVGKDASETAPRRENRALGLSGCSSAALRRRTRRSCFWTRRDRGAWFARYRATPPR